MSDSSTNIKSTKEKRNGLSDYKMGNVQFILTDNEMENLKHNQEIQPWSLHVVQSLSSYYKVSLADQSI